MVGWFSVISADTPAGCQSGSKIRLILIITIGVFQVSTLKIVCYLLHICPPNAMTRLIRIGGVYCIGDKPPVVR